MLQATVLETKEKVPQYGRWLLSNKTCQIPFVNKKNTKHELPFSGNDAGIYFILVVHMCALKTVPVTEFPLSSIAWLRSDVKLESWTKTLNLGDLWLYQSYK